jgi:acyl-CoA synthetase (NDP forming)
MGLKPEQIQAYREKEEQNIMKIRENIEKFEKPVALIWQGRGVNSDPTALTLLRKGKILAFSNTRRTARVINHLFRYRQYLDAIKAEK